MDKGVEKLLATIEQAYHKDTVLMLAEVIETNTITHRNAPSYITLPISLQHASLNDDDKVSIAKRLFFIVQEKDVEDKISLLWVIGKITHHTVLISAIDLAIVEALHMSIDEVNQLLIVIDNNINPYRSLISDAQKKDLTNQLSLIKSKLIGDHPLYSNIRRIIHHIEFVLNT